MYILHNKQYFNYTSILCVYTNLESITACNKKIEERITEAAFVSAFSITEHFHFASYWAINSGQSWVGLGEKSPSLGERLNIKAANARQECWIFQAN